MAATPHRNRRAYSETSPNLNNFGAESGGQQRSFSTSDISPERLEEGSVFDFSPLPTDLPETSQTDSEMTFERREQVPVRDDSSSQQIPVEVSDFIIRRQIESENNTLGTLAETESVATRIRTDLHIDTQMHDFSDFLDEFLEFELNRRNPNGSLEPTTVEGNTPMDRPVLGSMPNTSDSLQSSQTGEDSNGSCLYASNTTSVHEAWSAQTPVLYTSSELGFDYHSHLSSNHSNTSNARSDGFQTHSLVGPTFTSALDLSNIATTSYSKSTIAINSGNISPSSSASYSLSQRSPRAQAASQSLTYPTSWDTGQRSQCLLPVQNVQRDQSCTTDPSSNRTNLDKGVTKDPQCENAIAHPTGARKKRTVKKDKWSSKSSATGTKKSLPNEENNNKDNSQATDATQEPEMDTAVTTTSQKDKIQNGGAVQEQDITSSSSETTANMLPFTEEITMLNADNVSIFDQFEDRHFQGFDMYQNSMMSPQDFSMGEKQQAMAQPMASPMSPPEGDMFSADATTFYELQNCFYPSQPSPTSTVDSEQDMSEAYEIVMQDILSSMTPRLGISTDASQWSPEEAQAWISRLLQEYGRPEVNLSNFHQVDGYTLCQMTQDELEQRAPGSGYLIHSNLNCLAKSIQRDEIKPVLSPYQQQQHFHHQQQQQPPQPQVQPMSYDPNMMYTYPVTSMAPTSPAATERELSPSPLASSSDEEEASMSSPARSPTGPNTSMTPHHTGSIQLWQFLQELLLQPDSYNYCIRFLDRSQGIFKIEDSVEVARLWGMRKNRPAMNYDKLSRSIRQYYRKGIMKKTEISQRLVYQFVTPF